MAKIKLIHSFFFFFFLGGGGGGGDTADLRILQSDWFGVFCLITQELEFSQVRDFCKYKTNNMNCHLTPNPEKN